MKLKKRYHGAHDSIIVMKPETIHPSPHENPVSVDMIGVPPESINIHVSISNHVISYVPNEVVIERKPNSCYVNLAAILSFVANVSLLILKFIIYIISKSKAIFAAFADSIVDLISQVILSIASHYKNKRKT